MKRFVFVANCFDVNAVTYFCTPLSTVFFFFFGVDLICSFNLNVVLLMCIWESTILYLLCIPCTHSCNVIVRNSRMDLCSWSECAWVAVPVPWAHIKNSYWRCCGWLVPWCSVACGVGKQHERFFFRGVLWRKLSVLYACRRDINRMCPLAKYFCEMVALIH